MKVALLLLLTLFLSAGTLCAESLHRKAALEMMQTSGVPDMLKRSFDAQLEYEIKAVPELGKYRPQLTEFYKKAFSYKELESDLCALYMKHYTAEELQQLSAFYKTPVGKKMVKVNIQMTSEVAALFQKQAEKKMPELQKLLKELIKE